MRQKRTYTQIRWITGILGLPFVAASEAIEGDVDLTETTEALKETSHITFLESIRNVSNEKGRAASTFLLSPTVNGSWSTALLLKLTTRCGRTGAVARRRPGTVTSMAHLLIGRPRGARAVTTGRWGAIPAGRRSHRWAPIIMSNGN